MLGEPGSDVIVTMHIVLRPAQPLKAAGKGAGCHASFMPCFHGEDHLLHVPRLSVVLPSIRAAVSSRLLGTPLTCSAIQTAARAQQRLLLHPVEQQAACHIRLLLPCRQGQPGRLGRAAKLAPCRVDPL